ncbi:unnamed protein product [Knipowitschia caucasica]
MFGQEPHLPVDFLLGKLPEAGGVVDWVTEHRNRLQVAMDAARCRMEVAAQQRKERHDSQTLCPPLEPGQRVYLRAVGPGRRKIQDIWGPTMYQVVKAPAQQGVVYSVAPVDRLDQVRQVHRTALKPALPPPETSSNVWPQVAFVEDEASGDELELGAWLVVRESVSAPSTPVEPLAWELPVASPSPVVPSRAGSALRKSTRKTAGQHSNPHRLPGPIHHEENRVAASRIEGASSLAAAIFRPWS